MDKYVVRPLDLPDDCYFRFLCEKSKFELEEVLPLYYGIIKSATLKKLISARYSIGARCRGWTENASKGFTDISTGDIWIGKTNPDTELLTLAYECMNSENRLIYENIGRKFAQRADIPAERENFAREILSVEAKAMLIKCKLVTELGKIGLGLVKHEYLTIADNPSLDDATKERLLCDKMIEIGVVHGGKEKAFDFYKTKRYDEFRAYYSTSVAVEKRDK